MCACAKAHPPPAPLSVLLQLVELREAQVGLQQDDGPAASGIRSQVPQPDCARHAGPQLAACVSADDVCTYGRTRQVHQDTMDCCYALPRCCRCWETSACLARLTLAVPEFSMTWRRKPLVWQLILSYSSITSRA